MTSRSIRSHRVTTALAPGVRTVVSALLTDEFEVIPDFFLREVRKEARAAIKFEDIGLRFRFN